MKIKEFFQLRGSELVQRGDENEIASNVAKALAESFHAGYEFAGQNESNHDLYLEQDIKFWREWTKQS